ncbi:4-hydroxybenzoate synthetase [Moorena producens PAL-8-15-08-1]|uniref:4-hydroxybenzoate synthetase n=1 Tax=Moorena producens PAL-8-15-08-1 TaxID=1458985 RepID=A0A1D8TR94_9CYAN|nr:chorismate pyruvate-lyase family protein [Moorena producens]AOX00093.1 4-hydroxybenzoate synthetase [Moorena producens PAL-8-15-08-1]
MQMNAQTLVLRPIFTQNFPRKRNYIEPVLLSPFQRILLTTNGTVTDMIEAYSGEAIKIKKLFEDKIQLEEDILPMNLKKGTEVIARKVLLQGKMSDRTYVYADSILVLDRLNEKMRTQLLDTKTPIGKLWVENKVEIFKENVELGKEDAGDLADYFQIEPEDNLLYRTYCVISNNQYTMMITEKFPENNFRRKL